MSNCISIGLRMACHQHINSPTTVARQQGCQQLVVSLTIAYQFTHDGSLLAKLFAACWQLVSDISSTNNGSLLANLLEQLVDSLSVAYHPQLVVRLLLYVHIFGTLVAKSKLLNISYFIQVQLRTITLIFQYPATGRTTVKQQR